VLNLLSNAFKFTLKGEIEVRLETFQGNARLTVRDTGVGIPPEELPRMFERFHRIERSLGRTHEGTGIGLALVQELVKLHGGTITVASIPGEGSEFTVTIPLGNAHLDPKRIGAIPELAATLTHRAFVEEALHWVPDPPEAASKILESGKEPRSARRSRILWADDNADMRAYVGRLLGSRFDVEAVPDGAAALEAAKANPPDLILSDVMMPKLDGFGLLRALRGDPDLREIPIILVSARAGEESRIEGIEAGADDYIVKPFSARELVARVDTHVKMVAVRQEAKVAAQASVLLAAIVDSSDDAIVSKDLDGVITSWNKGAERLFGYTEAEALGQSIMMLIPPNRVQEETAILDQIKRGERVDHFETIRVRKDGTRLNISLSISPIKDPKGRVVGASKVARDITERVRQESALKEANVALQQANMDLQQFAYSA
jgi:PAS domain S-box-containing protein